MSQTVFKPVASVSFATSTTTANVALPARATHVSIYNASTTIAWCVFGTTAPTAAVPANGTVDPGFAVAPGATLPFTVPTGALFIGAILPAGASASTLYVTSGEGA
jgi:hypothetical protein